MKTIKLEGRALELGKMLGDLNEKQRVAMEGLQKRYEEELNLMVEGFEVEAKKTYHGLCEAAGVPASEMRIVDLEYLEHGDVFLKERPPQESPLGLRPEMVN